MIYKVLKNKPIKKFKKLKKIVKNSSKKFLNFKKNYKN